MMPESQLFPLYEGSLELQAAALEFNHRANTAFDKVHDELRVPYGPGAVRVVADASSIRSAIGESGLPDNEGIRKAFEEVRPGYGSEPVTAVLSRPYDLFPWTNAVGGKTTVESRIARFHASDPSYDIMRIVLMHGAATGFPDPRGVYIARARTDQHLVFFKIEPMSDGSSRASYGAGAMAMRAATTPAQLKAAAAGELPRASYSASALTPEERIAALEELEKAAGMPSFPRA